MKMCVDNLPILLIVSVKLTFSTVHVSILCKVYTYTDMYKLKERDKSSLSLQMHIDHTFIIASKTIKLLRWIVLEEDVFSCLWNDT